MCQDRSFTRGGQLRTQDLLEDLLRIQGTKKEWQRHGEIRIWTEPIAGGSARDQQKPGCTHPRVQPVQMPERSVHSSRV